MNVSHAGRFVLLAAPRTAARYVFGRLRERWPDLTGNPRRPHIVSHSLKVPAECAGYAKVATVMDPYRRWAAMWRWYAKVGRGPLAVWAAVHPTDFAGWTERAVERPPLSALGDVLPLDLDGMVRCAPEHLAGDLAAPPLNCPGAAYDERPRRHLYTAGVAALVRAAWPSDFKRWGPFPHP